MRLTRPPPHSLDSSGQGAFSGTGLAVFQSLASRGAQVIALHPGAPTPSIVQLVVLLREATRNERLYADECDLASVDSIRAFVLRWRKDAKAGMVGDVDVRVDGVLFLDSDDDEALAFGAAQKWASQRAAPDERVSRHRMRRLTGRHALVQLLLPVLLDSARTSTSPLRLISAVSPFYAVAAAQSGRLFRPEDLDYLAEGNEFPTRAPWEAEGQTALAAVLLWRELQSRLSSLAASGASASAGKTATPDAAAPATAPILALSVCPGLTRSSILSLLAPSLRRAPLRLLLALLGAPLVWLLAKSADEAAQGVLGALMARVEGESEAQRAAREEVHEGEEGRGAGKKVGGREEEDGKRRMRVRGGALYREGREVRCVVCAFVALSPRTRVFARARLIWGTFLLTQHPRP